MVDSAAERFRPQMMMWALPCVERAKAWAVAWPIPEVPPTKRAVGGWGGEKAALDARADESEGIVVGIWWLGKGYRTSYWLRVAMTAFVMTCQCHR